MPLDQDQAHPRAGRQRPQPLGRVLRIERQIGAAGPYDRQQPGDQLGGALGTDPDRLFRPEAQGPQSPGQGAGAAVQLAVAPEADPPTGFLPDYRRRLRRGPRLPRDQTVEGSIGVRRGLGGPGVVPLLPQLCGLGFGEDGERREAQVRAARQPRQQETVPVEQAHGRHGVEEIGRQVEPKGDLRRFLAHLRREQMEIELAGAGLDRPGGELKIPADRCAGTGPAAAAAEREGGERRIGAGRCPLDREGGLHERGPAGIAVAVRQQGERVVLAGERAAQSLAHAPQVVRCPRVVAATRPHRQEVDEVADHAGGGGVGAACSGDPGEEIVLSGAAVEEQVKGGEEQRGERDTRGRGAGAELGREVRGEAGVPRHAEEGAPRRTWPVGRQVDHRRCAREPGIPALAQGLAVETQPPGPCCGELDERRYGSERRGRPADLFAVDPPQLAEENRKRPEVRHQMVDDEQQERRTVLPQE